MERISKKVVAPTTTTERVSKEVVAPETTIQRISKKVVAPAELAGRRLDQAAATLMPEFSRSRLKSWIDAGRLTVDGANAAAKSRLAGGEELVLETELEALAEVGPEAIPLAIVWQDDALCVIDKPAGLVVHPGAGNRSGTLQNALLNVDPALAAVPRAGLVHRLDKDTSGLLVVARTLAAHASLVAQLEARRMGRVYEAVCQGVLSGGGTIEAPLGRHPRERTKMAVREGGRPARTSYRVLERFRAHTHVELRLDTGRTHQIRVHMAHLRAPLVGDRTYGGRPRFPRAPSESLRAVLEAFGRQALHAARLELEHPGDGRPLAFESALPRISAHCSPSCARTARRRRADERARPGGRLACARTGPGMGQRPRRRGQPRAVRDAEPRRARRRRPGRRGRKSPPPRRRARSPGRTALARSGAWPPRRESRRALVWPGRRRRDRPQRRRLRRAERRLPAGAARRPRWRPRRHRARRLAGSVHGVIEAAVEAMQTPPAELFVWLGPAIGPEAYEVGDDVRSAFVGAAAEATAAQSADTQAATAFRPNERGRWQADFTHSRASA